MTTTSKANRAPRLLPRAGRPRVPSPCERPLEYLRFRRAQAAEGIVECARFVVRTPMGGLLPPARPGGRSEPEDRLAVQRPEVEASAKDRAMGLRAARNLLDLMRRGVLPPPDQFGMAVSDHEVEAYLDCYVEFLEKMPKGEAGRPRVAQAFARHMLEYGVRALGPLALRDRWDFGEAMDLDFKGQLTATELMAAALAGGLRGVEPTLDSWRKARLAALSKPLRPPRRVHGEQLAEEQLLRRTDGFQARIKAIEARLGIDHLPAAGPGKGWH